MRGVCEAFDNRQFREIALMWGTQLGKTFLFHAIALCVMTTRPAPGIFASATERLARASVREKIYNMIEQCAPLRGQLKSQKDRSVDRIELQASHWRVAWSGSHTALADFSAEIIVCNEVSKWNSRGGEEGDPLDLIYQRFKFYDATYKALVESSPTLRGRCRIEAKVKLSTNCRYQVPCPHCRHYQTLSMKQLRWDHLADGTSDPELAERTARYECLSCRRAIHDEQRRRMMQAGVWVPEGQSVDGRGRDTAADRRQGREGRPSVGTGVVSLAVRHY